MCHFQNYLQQSLTASIGTSILYNNNNKIKFVDRVAQKVTTNPKLGQNRKRRSIEEKQAYSHLLIVFIVTLYSLQKNTKFVDRVEQKVTTNPKLGQIVKVGQPRKQVYHCFDCVHCNFMEGRWM